MRLPASTTPKVRSSPTDLRRVISSHEHAGLRVIATARKMDSMTELSALGIATFELDVSETESIRAVKQRVTEMNNGRLDMLVNNA